THHRDTESTEWDGGSSLPHLQFPLPIHAGEWLSCLEANDARIDEPLRHRTSHVRHDALEDGAVAINDIHAARLSIHARNQEEFAVRRLGRQEGGLDVRQPDLTSRLTVAIKHPH